jgi:CHAT domain-containing protein
VAAIDPLVRAMALNGHAMGDEIVTLATRALKLADLRSTRQSPQLATALDDLGLAHAARGEDALAIPLHERAIAIDTQSGDAAGLATALEHLAGPLINLERWDEARTALERALRIRDARRGVAAVDVANVEELLALLYRQRGEFPAAQQHLDLAVSIRSEFTPGHPRLAALQHLRGDLAFLRGNLSEARTAYSAALSLATARLRPGHPLISLYSRKVAVTEWAFGDSLRARALREAALQIAEATLAPCHPDLLGAENDLAGSYLAEGDYSGARRMFERTLSGYERCQGKSHSLTATAAYNLGVVAGNTGDWSDAERYLKRAAQVWSAGLGPSHPFVLRARDALAEVAASRGLNRQAFAMYQQVLATRRKAMGANHPDVARTLTALARLARRLGDTTLALKYADEAEAIYARAGAADEAVPLTALLELRADIERSRGDRGAAVGHLSEALAMWTRQFGADHPDAASARAALAGVELQAGNFDKAVGDALAAEDVGQNLLRATIRDLPERQALAFADTRPKGLDVALSVLAADPRRNPVSVYDALIHSRGVVLDELASRKHANVTTDAATAALIASLGGARQRYANLMLRASEDPGAVPRERLDAARLEREAAERAVASRSAAAREEQVRTAAGLAAIRGELGTGAALVSFIRYNRTLPPAAAGREPKPLASYAAFVVSPDGDAAVSFVPLGSAQAIDAAVRAWKAAIRVAPAASTPAARAAAERAYRRVAGRLRAAAWDPVAAQLAPARRVFIVADGLLNVVNFAALPGTDGRYLVQADAVLHYLSTERDLLAGAPRTRLASALVVGRPAFDRVLPRPAPVSALRAACIGYGGMRFVDLPGTGREAAEVSKLWSASDNVMVHVLTGAEATETALKHQLSGNRVIHLATHGFFLGDACPNGTAGSRAVGGLVTVGRPAPAAVENPLLLSGLAFAGANRRAPASADQDDGILTAEEIAGLNLDGTEWAVLSACDTGLGEIRAGEGVFGLRRAFQIAGARTVIMSLWSVDDEATRQWMKALYEGRLQRHLDTAESVREASLAVLEQRRAAGLSTHPFYWAAFVAAGDWR